MMKRRAFLRTGSAVTLPVLVNGFNLGLLPRSALFGALDGDSDRVLVLVQLDGGNDGLNTLIPLDQYARLSAARSNILIPESQVIPLLDDVGLHPAMTGFKSLFDDGKLTAIQSVAYPNQNRSHFRSSDIWVTGSAADTFLTSGWLGRYLDNRYPGYPEGYPNEDNPDPFAITVRSTVSETCQGQTSNFSMAVTDPFNVGQLVETPLDELPDTNFGTEMRFLINAIAQTNAYSDIVLDAANAGSNLSTMYDEASALAQQLKTVALLISGGLRTKIFVVRIGGFDTHANQVTQGSSTVGQHAVLLEDLSNAIAAFQDDLKLQGLEERVLGMTFSEFGRQIASNDSYGTDHGTAAPLFLFGSCVNGGIVGQNPTIPSALEPQEGVAMQHDYRSVYATVLKDWLGADTTETEGLLYGQFAYLPIIAGCDTSGVGDNLPGHEVKPYVINVYPNPVNGTGNIQFESGAGDIRISLFDQLGREVQVIADRYFSHGRHTVPFETDDLHIGTYHVRIAGKDWQQTRRIVKY